MTASGLLILELLQVAFAVMILLLILAGVSTLALLIAGALVLDFMTRRKK
jgi:hypothetical protein